MPPPTCVRNLLEAIESERAGYVDGTTGDPLLLARGLEAAISTPLGGLAGGTRLRDLGRADRLDELVFELPLAGGDDPVGDVLLSDLAIASPGTFGRANVWPGTGQTCRGHIWLPTSGVT